MSRTPQTVVPAPPYRTSIWTALVLLQALLGAFAIFALLLSRDHAWADRLLARLPAPGRATSLSADPGLVNQLRVAGQTAWYTRLADQTSVLVAEADVMNDALLPVHNIIVVAEARKEDKSLATSFAGCGKAVSNRLLGRLPREELATLLDVNPPTTPPLAPGRARRCQVAFMGMAPGADEVIVKIASVEPHPGHPLPRFRPAE